VTEQESKIYAVMRGKWETGRRSTNMDNKVYRSELTPVSFLRRSAYMFPEKTAVVYGDRRYTYADLEERVNRLASRLRDSGLQKGDRVAFLCPNTPPHLEAHFAVPASAKTRLRSSSSTLGRRWSSSTRNSRSCSRMWTKT
jgi:non-ribosomal peptide synthetase component F